MKITLLGCGTSVGVPSLGILGWGKCNPNNPKNRRQRSSVLIQDNGYNILIDAGPDVRNQLLNANVDKIDAVLITHTHSDHISGLPDLRPFFFAERKNIPIFGQIDSLNEINSMFDYLFEKKPSSPSYFTPPMTLNEIREGQLNFFNFNLEVFIQHHGNINTLGFKFNNKFAYSTDVVKMPDKNFKILKNLDLWIVESLREQPHEAHAHFELTFEWIDKVKPKTSVLTHLGHEDYDHILSICPKNVYPGYDGMEFQI